MELKTVRLLVVLLPLENFHSYGDVTINGEELQVLAYAWHSLPLCDSSACHTYCDSG